MVISSFCQNAIIESLLCRPNFEIFYYFFNDIFSDIFFTEVKVFAQNLCFIFTVFATKYFIYLIFLINSCLFSKHSYRRAPQFPFPIPIQDCLDVTKYILQKGDKYGIDVNGVGVAGEY